MRLEFFIQWSPFFHENWFEKSRIGGSDFESNDIWSKHNLGILTFLFSYKVSPFRSVRNE